MEMSGSLIFAFSWGSFSFLLARLIQRQWDGFHFLTIFSFLRFCCYLLEACSFIKRDQKDIGPDKRGSGEELGVEGGETIFSFIL